METQVSESINIPNRGIDVQEVWTEATALWQKGVKESVGGTLSQAKAVDDAYQMDKVDPGKFKEWYTKEARISKGTASCFMSISRSVLIREAFEAGKSLPSEWTKLYELSQLDPVNWTTKHTVSYTHRDIHKTMKAAFEAILKQYFAKSQADKDDYKKDSFTDLKGTEIKYSFVTTSELKSVVAEYLPWKVEAETKREERKAKEADAKAKAETAKSEQESATKASNEDGVSATKPKIPVVTEPPIEAGSARVTVELSPEQTEIMQGWEFVWGTLQPKYDATKRHKIEDQIMALLKSEGVEGIRLTFEPLKAAHA